jgi:GT2 family glycosyltransferase
MAEPLPKISFIMPTLNAAALLDNCLASIARQTYPRARYEIILADAMSRDARAKLPRNTERPSSMIAGETWSRANGWRCHTPPVIT